VSNPTTLILSECGIPGSIATMLGRCDMVMAVVVLTREGEICDIGDIVSELPGLNISSSSVGACIIGRRIQCFGTSLSSSRRGQKWIRRGLSAMSEAQMIPMLTSMADHVTAWMPDSTPSQLRSSVLLRHKQVLTNKSTASLQKVDSRESDDADNANEEAKQEHEYQTYLLLSWKP